MLKKGGGGGTGGFAMVLSQKGAHVARVSLHMHIYTYTHPVTLYNYIYLNVLQLIPLKNNQFL